MIEEILTLRELNQFKVPYPSKINKDITKTSFKDFIRFCIHFYSFKTILLGLRKTYHDHKHP